MSVMLGFGFAALELLAMKITRAKWRCRANLVITILIIFNLGQLSLDL